MGKIQAKRLLTTGEVAELFSVDPKTVVRWANTGKLTSIRTLGGHRRFRAEEVMGLLDLPMPTTRQPVDDVTRAWRDLATRITVQGGAAS